MTVPTSLCGRPGCPPRTARPFPGRLRLRIGRCLRSTPILLRSLLLVASLGAVGLSGAAAATPPKTPPKPGAPALPAPPAPPTAPAPAPVLSRVEQTAEGYALVGSGFGADPGKVQVFEDDKQVAASAVASVANERIVVRAKPSGTIRYRVVVAGQASQVVSFTHSPAAPASPRKDAIAGELKRGPQSVPSFPKTLTLRDLTMTGLRFTPKTLTLGDLTMTGLRFTPKTLTLGDLTMTGLRFVPKAVTLGDLTMTGLRFVPKTLTLGEMTMTGLR